MEKILDKEALEEIFRKEIYAYKKSRKSYWAEKKVVETAIKLEIVNTERLNVSQGDGTFKTIILFEGRTFVYVGEKIET